jgi:hypothetical protein
MSEIHPKPSFQKLHTEISHAVEITEYLTASLSNLDAKLRGFVNENGPVPPTVRESICHSLGHQANVAGFLFESLEALTAALCRNHAEPDITGTDVAVQHIRNGENGGAA